MFESRLPDTNIGPESRLFENCPRLTTIFVPTKDIAMVRAGREIVNRYSWETIFKISGLNAHKAYLWRQYESVVDKMTDHVPFADEAVRRMSDEAFVGHYRDTLTLPAQLENIGTWGLALHIGRLIFESPTPPYYNFSEGVPHFILAKEVCVPIGAGDVYRHTKGWEHLPIEERPFAAPVSYTALLKWPSPPPAPPFVIPSHHSEFRR